jgi:5-oxopent-3-ene-1,2,5-tricarboxylate decarboxylase / 2-hydroxyhepta-2,4-diene-1,7-dioate isomerase
MKIGCFAHELEPFLGAVFEERVIDLMPSRHDPFLLTEVLVAGHFSVQLFQSLFDRCKEREELWHDLRSVTYLSLFQPGKIICLGLNYAEHAREGGRDVPEEPIFFEKAVSAMISHEQPVIYPDNLGRIDPEPELAVVIGMRARKVDEADVPDHIAGYTILNDVTARDMQAKDMRSSQPWYRSKSIDTFCPVGPWIVTADEIDPLAPLNIQLRVNGEKRVEGTTADLIFKIPEIISRISSLITLEAGDIVSTGTPAGIAPVYPNDVMEIEIEGIGTLKNPVKAVVRRA